MQWMPLTSTCVLESQLLEKLYTISVGLSLLFFCEYYLQAPNTTDVARLLEEDELEGGAMPGQEGRG